MKCKLETEYIIKTSDCDHSACLGIPQAFEMFMDIASIHAESIGVGAKFMMEKGMFWLTAKTRVHIYRKPRMMETVRLSTWPLKPRGVQEIRDYSIHSQKGEVMLEGKTQWAMMDMKSGGLVKIQDVFPDDLDLIDEAVLNESFARISEDVSDCTEYAEYKVRSVDIDLGGHMNNTAYVKALFGTFSTEELDKMNICDCEICYKNPCFEGDVLKFFKRTTEKGMEIVVRSNDKTAILAKMF